MSLFNDLPVAFPWYDKLEKQNRYKEHVQKIADYKLLTPYDALLPFQFRRAKSTFPPVIWEVFEINTHTLIVDITPSIDLFLHNATIGDYDYFYYGGETLHAVEMAEVDMRCGFYYSKITMADETKFFSEMFHVPGPGFSIANGELTDNVKLEWWNDNDIPPIFYNDKDSGSGLPFFRNVVYLDTFIHVSEPEILEDTTSDGYDKPIPTFQRAVIRYRIADLVPDFLKVALVIIQMHDNAIITTGENLYSGQLEGLTTTSQMEEGGALSMVEILFEENVAIIKKSCPDNMELLEIGITPGLPILYGVGMGFGGSNALVNAEIEPGYWGILYGSVDGFEPWVQINGPFQYQELLDNATFPASLITVPGYEWFKLKMVNFNLDDGLFTNLVELS